MTDVALDVLDTLLARAVDSGNVDVVNQLLEERRDTEHRAAREAYLAAMASVAPETFRVVRDATGARANQRYASLDAILSHVRPPLLEAGITIGFDTEPAPESGFSATGEPVQDRVVYVCELSHTGGYTHRARAPVTREAASNRMNATQRDGSAQTYGMRYALLLALGIATGEDDDGRAAGAQEPVVPVSAEQAAELRALAEEIGLTPDEQQRWFRHAGAEGWSTFPKGRYAAAIAKLKERQRAGT